ncbi:MAG: hypothetical protein AB1630_11180 [bacterium]
MKKYFLLLFIVIIGCAKKEGDISKKAPSFKPGLESSSEIKIKGIEEEYCKKEEFLGEDVLIPRPTKEIKDAILKLVKKYPKNPELYKRLSDIEINLSQFDEAESHFIKYVNLCNRNKISLKDLADFYDSRLLFDKKIKVLEELAEKENREDAVSIYKNIILSLKTYLLSLDKYHYYNKIIELFPDSPIYFKEFIDELISCSEYKLANNRLVCCPLNKVCYILQGFPAYVHANGFAFLL